MLRLLHFSDLHIGVENYGRTDPQTGLNTRLADFLATYDGRYNGCIRGKARA